MPRDIHVEEGDGVLFLLLHGKLNAGVDRVQTASKVLCWVPIAVVVAAAEPGAARDRRCLKDAPYIIHIYEDMLRYGEEALPGQFDGALHGVRHPDLGDEHHEAKSYRAAILGGVVAVIV